MRDQRLFLVLVLALAVLIIVVILVTVEAPTPPGMALKIEWCGMTNIPPSASPGEDWLAYNATGKFSGLPAASPSHALFRLTNGTRRIVDYRFLLYDFADGEATRTDIAVHHGIRFGPSENDVGDYQALKPGEKKWIALPRPPFECVWRANVDYMLPMTIPQDVFYSSKGGPASQNVRSLKTSSIRPEGRVTQSCLSRRRQAIRVTIPRR